MSAHDYYSGRPVALTVKSSDYARRYEEAVEARDHDMVDAVLDDLANDRSVTIAQLEEMFGAERNSRVRTRADLIEVLRTRARDNILDADRSDAQSRVPL